MSKNHKKRRILVVDDEQSVTRMLKLNLELTGHYEVLEENSAKHVIHAARVFHPDLLVLDVLMPDLTGDYVAQELRDIRGWHHVPIVLLTAIADRRSRVCSSAYDRYMAKPVKMPDLIRCIEELLEVARQDVDQESLARHS